MMSSYEDAKRERDALEAACRDASVAFKAIYDGPRGPMGLTPDAIKFSPAYVAAKARCDVAFQALRRFNSSFTKTFAKEIREGRRRRFIS